MGIASRLWRRRRLTSGDGHQRTAQPSRDRGVGPIDEGLVGDAERTTPRGVTGPDSVPSPTPSTSSFRCSGSRGASRVRTARAAGPAIRRLPIAGERNATRRAGLRRCSCRSRRWLAFASASARAAALACHLVRNHVSVTASARRNTRTNTHGNVSTNVPTNRFDSRLTLGSAAGPEGPWR